MTVLKFGRPLVALAALLLFETTQAKVIQEAQVLRNPQLAQQIQGLVLPKRLRVVDKRAVLLGRFSEKGWKLAAALPHKLKPGRPGQGGFRVVLKFTGPSQSVILTATGPRGMIVEEKVQFEIPPSKWIEANP